MSDRIVSREEFISAVGVNGNPVQMAQRSALLINHDRALRAERDALRADLLALVPLARLAVEEDERRAREAGFLPNKNTHAARAILARVAREGGT